MKKISTSLLLIFIAVFCHAANVARIGSTNYENLSQAIKDAKKGQTVTILSDIQDDIVVDSQSFGQGESIVVDFAGNTLTGNLSLMTNNGTITFKNGTISGTFCGEDAGIPGKRNYTTSVIFENMTITAVHADGHALELRGGVYQDLINSYAIGTTSMHTIMLDNSDNHFVELNNPGDYDRGDIVLKNGHYRKEYWDSTISLVSNHSMVFSWNRIEKNDVVYKYEIIENVPVEDHCYQISTPEQLISFSKIVANHGVDVCRGASKAYFIKNARLLNDINMSGYEFIPIGVCVFNENTSFDGDLVIYYDGEFDGCGHTISNIDISWTHAFRNAAMFGRVSRSAVIKNISIKNVSAYGIETASGLVGECHGGSIYNSSLVGTTSFETAGGVANGSLIYEVKGNEQTSIFSSYTTCGNLVNNNSLQPNITYSYYGSDVASKAASGELCYLLNNQNSQFVSGGWRQNIDAKGKVTDAYPVYATEHSIVYFDTTNNKYTNSIPSNYVSPSIKLQKGQPVPISMPVALQSDDNIQLYTIAQVTNDGTALLFPVNALDVYSPGAVMAKNKEEVFPLTYGEGSSKKYTTLWDGTTLKVDGQISSWTAELVNRNVLKANELSFQLVDPANINIVVNVENRDVQRYMTETDYSEQTATTLYNYVDERIKQDCPQAICIPLSDSSIHYINNLIPGTKTSFEKVDANGNIYKGVITATGTVRMIKVPTDKVVNIRDLGGKKTSYGGKIKYGKLFRNGELEYGDTEDLNTILDLGIGAEIDLRGPVDYPTNNSAFGFTNEEGTFLYGNFRNCNYEEMTTGEGPAKFRKVLEFVVDNLKKGKAVDFHCAAGADRTGLFGGLFCALLGCTMDDIYKEFELTSFSMHRDRTTKVARDRFVDDINRDRNRIGNTFNEKVEDYFINCTGASPELIEEFRSLLITGYNGETDTDDTDISQYDNIVYASNTEAIKVDGEDSSRVAIPVNLKNSDTDICGFQFDMQLPAGMTIAKDAAGKALVELAGTRASASTHFVKATAQSDGSTRIVCTSFGNDAFKGRDGLVLNVSVDVAASVAIGDYDIVLKNIVMSNSIPEGYKVAECKSTLTVSDVMLGDVNCDKEVDIIDVAGIVNLVLGKDCPTLSRSAADVNRDGSINISDASGAVNIILYGSVTEPVQRVAASGDGAASLNIDPVKVANSGSVVLPVALSSIPYNIISLQTDVILPEGVTLAGIECDNEHIVQRSEMPDGSIRIACFSLSNAPFEGNGAEVMKLNLEVSENAASGVIRMSNSVLTRQNITSIYAEDASAAFCFGETTAVNSARTDAENIVRYDLQGRKAHTTTPQRGIYILKEGKKIVK